jgi:alanyl-tRNA synthetase
MIGYHEPGDRYCELRGELGEIAYRSVERLPQSDLVWQNRPQLRLGGFPKRHPAAFRFVNEGLEESVNMTSAPDRLSHGSRWMSGSEVRRAFIQFFEERRHRELPSSSLVPHNDPTVLLTTAGMQQMTPYFLGLETPPSVRLCSVQKCFRTVDIDEVGDESHCTFFFMLGNFSVGDYFKRESLAWSWEFLTEVMGLDPERLYPTVHPDDEDAYRIWRDEIKVPRERIGKLSDNWWGPVGPTGPNGPDSEIYFDLGPEAGGVGDGPGDSDRFLEVWNNVFMEFFQAEDGSRAPLPKQNVDTGMGLERLTAIMQSVNSIYDTDLYQAIIQRAARLAGTPYGANEESDRALRVIADHARGATFLISDGVLPGNEGRSYVLRRILRRAIRFGRQLGLTDPFLGEMAAVVIEQFGADYPTLRERQRQIERVLGHEEDAFGRTLSLGLSRFQEEVAKVRANAPTDTEISQLVLPGRVAFRLYDTYGFPLDLTIDLAKEHGLSVDQAGFDDAMAAQREVSRGGEAFRDASRDRAKLYVAQSDKATEFLGYAETDSEAKIIALLGAEGPVTEGEAGDEVEIILDRTPFYGESGGQVGDKGVIRSDTGVVNVDNTFKPTPALHVHRGRVAEGFIRVGETVRAHIDSSRRRAIMRNHTATHLLHRALRIVLGEETHQAGSLVAPDRLRFDFTSLETMTPAQLYRLSEIVNEQIVASTPVSTSILPYDEAISSGAMALFGEKYGVRVRVVSIGDFSRELCGGTHLAHTGEVGPFAVVSEGSVAAGVRRIEALTGTAAIERNLKQQQTIETLARDLRSPWTELPDQIRQLREKLRESEREVSRLRSQLAGTSAGDLAEQTIDVEGIPVLAAKVSAGSREELRQTGDQVRDKLGSGVIVLGALIDDKPGLLAIVTPDLVSKGIRAGDVIRQTALHIDGRGGGRADIAEAGGRDAAGLERALSGVPDLVRDLAAAS